MACVGTRRAAGTDGAEVADTTGPTAQHEGRLLRETGGSIPTLTASCLPARAVCFAAQPLLYHNGYRDLSEGASPPWFTLGGFLVGARCSRDKSPGGGRQEERK
jgi:hypothetical protein